MIDRAVADLVSTEAALLEGLPRKDRDVLAGLLGRLAAHLERHGEGPGR
ncbi:MAG: hypothetical protein JOY82_20475 [Streptosporangiaceae bacterium]|nr:hypothetical protein [Streptosporangiaceae bacterium]MBV9856861.1 hypothetical protein [Streptosporangiaceae bacterium]